jgi:hypothetical protein
VRGGSISSAFLRALESAWRDIHPMRIVAQILSEHAPDDVDVCSSGGGDNGSVREVLSP